MELKLFNETSEIKDFTKKTLMNESIYCYNGSIEIIKKYWQEADNVNEFALLVVNDERLKHNQGYWELAKELKNYRQLMHDYLKDICEVYYNTSSDMGSLKIGNDSFKMFINNKYGDGTNSVYIIKENDARFWFNYETMLEGENIGIYNYDCGNRVIHTLNGNYMLYVEERVFIFVKCSE